MVQESQVDQLNSVSIFEIFRRLVAAFSIFSVLLLFIVVSNVFMRPLIPIKPLRMKVVAWWMSKCCGLFLFILRGRLEVVGGPWGPSSKSFMISNHLSYLDVLAISSLQPSCFVTSQEINEQAFLGHLARASCSQFVERRSYRDIQSEIANLKQVLESGVSITVFPEATSSNGEKVLPFYRMLFRSAVQACVEVRPFCLNYRTFDGVPISQKNKDHLFWYGDMTFFDHLWKLICTRGGFVLEVSYLDPIPVEGKSEKELVQEAQAAISNRYEPIQK